MLLSSMISRSFLDETDDFQSIWIKMPLTVFFSLFSWSSTRRCAYNSWTLFKYLSVALENKINHLREEEEEEEKRQTSIWTWISRLMDFCIIDNRRRGKKGKRLIYIWCQSFSEIIEDWAMQLALLVLLLISCIFAKNNSSKHLRCSLEDQSNACQLLETMVRVRRQINYGKTNWKWILIVRSML